MGVDERLRRELGSLAPADPSGAYERVVEKRVRRGFARRAQIVALTVMVVAGSALGVYGLLKAFGVGDRATPAVPSESGILFADLVGEQGDVFVVQPDGSGLRNLTHDEAGEANSVWSPDGGRIAFLRFDLATGTSDVYVMDADGTGLRQVTESGGAASGPTWSPDGSRLAYVDEGLRIIPVEGGDPRLLVEGRVSDPTWSPDGEQIAYSFPGQPPEPGDELSGVDDLWAVPADGGEPTRLTHTIGADYGADWSPDGRRIVFTSDRDIAVLDLATGDVHLLTGAVDPEGDAYDRDPAWSPDGSQIVFVSDRVESGVMRLYRMNSDGSDPTPVLDRAFTYGLCCVEPDWAGHVPPIPVVTSGPPPAEVPTALPGVGPVCGLSSVEGDFLGEGTPGVAHVYAEVDDAGGCPPEGAGTHVLGIDVGSGRVAATSSPLECGLGGCSAFAAPDIDGDGRAEIAIRVPSSGVPWDFVSLYRVTGSVGGTGDAPPTLASIQIARTVDTKGASFTATFGGPGPTLLPWGGNAAQRAGGSCLPATTGHDAGPARLSWWVATSEGQDRWHVVNPTFDASRHQLVAMGIGDYLVPDQVPSLPAGGGDTFCGALVVG